MDLLELVGMIRKIKNVGDRKLYVRLDGDLLEGLRTALLFKLQKDIAATTAELERYEQDERARDAARKLKAEIQRLKIYVDELAKIEVPKKD